MLSLAHTVISLPFGVYLQNPILIFAFAFGFHFVLDSIYHWNIYPPHHPRFPAFLVGLDIAGGLIMAWVVIGNGVFSLPILAAILGGNSPDIIHTLWFLAGRPRSRRFPFLTFFFYMHDRIQWETRSVSKGLVPQLIITLFAILLIA